MSSLRSKRDLTYFEEFKRFLDVLVALGLLIVLFPQLLLIATLVKLTSAGPIFYKQKRLTWGGRTFIMYKFRTMVSDAEKETGAVWTQENDPRVTPLGRFLRITRFDELPQLLNVVIGDMSLVGPRPERPEMAKELEKELPSFRRRMDVQGGITGLAQTTSGYAASTKEYQQKLDMDLQYVKDRSLWLDLKIAIKTIWVVITGRGAR